MLTAALVPAAIFVVPTVLMVVAFLILGKKIHWPALTLAAFSFLVYVVLLKSRHVVPLPDVLADISLLWIGKVMSLGGTIALLYLLPSVSFRTSGLTLQQHPGSLRPVAIAGFITLVSATTTTYFMHYDPDTSVENLLFQATLPGLDEELYMRGLLLLLLHQAFGKDLIIFGAQTGWGFWLVVVIFGLLHGVTTSDGGVQIQFGMIIATGFVGFILTWMRERTGSLLVPILFHNLFNLCQAFV